MRFFSTALAFAASLALVSASPLNLTPTKTTPLNARADINPTPNAPGDPTNGWQALPAASSATVKANWDLGDAKFPLYQSSGRTKSEIKRAVIILPGKPRDCWNYWNLANNALILGAEQFSDVKESEVSIMAPCFLAEIDLAAGGATDDQLLFGLTTWISGHQNVAPAGVSMSSYEVMDKLVEHYMDKSAYPNLETVVIGGHSAGAQMAQRYAALRVPTENDADIHYWIANPGSILWLVEDRPAPNDSCDGVDEYKYGLSGGFPKYASSDANKMGRSGIVERYRGRNMHYAWGLNDNGAGDTRCQAVTTGSTHLERGQNFIEMLHDMDGGIPDATTYDYVEGVSHDSTAMIYSDAGIDKLIRFPY